MLPAPLRVMLALPKRMFFACTSMAALSPSSAATANVPATSTASGGAEAQRFLDGEVARGSQAQRALAAHEVAAVCKGADGGVAGEAEAQVVDLGSCMSMLPRRIAPASERMSRAKPKGPSRKIAPSAERSTSLPAWDARGGLEAGERARREAVNAQGAAGAHGHAALRGFEGELAAVRRCGRSRRPRRYSRPWIRDRSRRNRRSVRRWRRLRRR